MNPETTRVPENSSVFLNSCLVEGDPVQQEVARKIRRRAICLSVILQSLTLAALIVFPLLSKGERLPIKMFVEPPPYRLGSANQSSGPTGHHESGPSKPCLFCKQTLTPGRPTNNRTGETTTTISGDDPGIDNAPFGDPNGNRYGVDLPASAPPRPNPDDQHPQQTPRLVIGHIDPARLTHRVEPRYPTMGIQLRRETRVELQAVIAVDGSIQSLQVISGDPLFYQSAMEAVRQWQYSPTILNGRAVEVDTHISVIYSLNH
jgi:TonB family protein